MYEILIKKLKLFLIPSGALLVFIISADIFLLLSQRDYSLVFLLLSFPVIALLFGFATLVSINSFRDLNNWYVQILDFVYLPMSITDMDMNWTFINKPVKDIIGVTREQVLGQQCFHWAADICRTEDCGICKLRNGQGTSFFTNEGVEKNFQVDTTYLFDRKKRRIGHLELVSDITAKVRLDEAVEQLKLYSGEKIEPVEHKTMLDEYGVDNSNMRQFTILEDSISAEELFNLTMKANVANKAKSDFLANMSHEIRTPMNAILGFTEILKDKIAVPEYIGYLESIHTSGKSLLSLINDILDLSKVEAGKMKLEISVVSLENFFNEIRTIFNQRVKDKGLDFLIDIPANVPEALLIDINRLRQILINLLGNAVKFTEEGQIVLSARFEYPSGNESGSVNIILSVEDTGIGIPDDHLDKIFDVFSQVQDQEISKYGGTGLGLSITKGLVEIMGGEIHVNSEVDKGSRFEIRFDDMELAPLDVKSSLNRAIDLQAIHFEKSSLLIVDDIKVNRDLIKGYLEDYDLSIEEAVNGKDAIEKMRKIKPDLTLMDMKMPEMSGYEAMRIIKSDRALSDNLVIALTASAMKKDEEAINKLCDSYLRKPVSKWVLIEKLQEFLPHDIEIPATGKAKIDIETSPGLNILATPDEREIEILYDIALRGNLNKIINMAKELHDQNAEYASFSHRLIDMATSYQDEELIRFLEMFRKKPE